MTSSTPFLLSGTMEWLRTTELDGVDRCEHISVGTDALCLLD
jgi:hypothetical protein